MISGFEQWGGEGYCSRTTVLCTLAFASTCNFRYRPHDPLLCLAGVQMSHKGRMNTEVVVEPGEVEVAHHLMIVDATQPYRYPGYSLAWRWEAAK